jgi:hypothetical protein
LYFYAICDTYGVAKMVLEEEWRSISDEGQYLSDQIKQFDPAFPWFT